MIYHLLIGGLRILVFINNALFFLHLYFHKCYKVKQLHTNYIFIFYYNNQQFNEFGTIIHLEKISRKIICPQQDSNPRPSNVRLDATFFSG